VRGNFAISVRIVRLATEVQIPAWAHFQATILLENHDPISECEKTLRSSVQGEHLNFRFEPRTEKQPVNLKKSQNSLSQRAFKQATDLQFPCPMMCHQAAHFG
jgi:hypothetical protein